MSFLNGIQGALGGGLGGALLGGVTGLMFGGPFGAIPGAMLGGGLGAVGGGLSGLFQPNYQQMMGAYNPQMMGWGGGMNQFGGMAMPPYMMSTVQPGFGMGGFGTGLATGALTGMVGGAMAGAFMNPWSFPSYGMGWGGLGSWGAMGAWGMGVPVGVGGLDANVFTWY